MNVCQCGYPDDIQMARLVVEQMERNGWFFVMEYDSKDCLDVAFYTESKHDAGRDGNWVTGKLTEAPALICLAALKAICVDPKKKGAR